MRKSALILIISSLAATLLLSGCFSKNAPKGSASLNGAFLLKQNPQMEQDSKDGDVYLQALFENDVSLCRKISNVGLREKCRIKAAEK